MIVVVRIVFPTAKALAADLHERLGHDKGYWPTADRSGAADSLYQNYE